MSRRDNNIIENLIEDRAKITKLIFTVLKTTNKPNVMKNVMLSILININKNVFWDDAKLHTKNAKLIKDFVLMRILLNQIFILIFIYKHWTSIWH